MDRVMDLLFPFRQIPSVLVYTHVSVGVFTGTSFFLSRLVDSIGFGWMDRLWICLAVFPRLKGRTNIYLFSSFKTIDVVDFKS